MSDTRAVTQRSDDGEVMSRDNASTKSDSMSSAPALGGSAPTAEDPFDADAAKADQDNEVRGVWARSSKKTPVLSPPCAVQGVGGAKPFVFQLDVHANREDPPSSATYDFFMFRDENAGPISLVNDKKQVLYAAVGNVVRAGVPEQQRVVCGQVLTKGRCVVGVFRKGNKKTFVLVAPLSVPVTHVEELELSKMTDWHVDVRTTHQFESAESYGSWLKGCVEHWAKLDVHVKRVLPPSPAPVPPMVADAGPPAVVTLFATELESLRARATIVDMLAQKLDKATDKVHDLKKVVVKQETVTKAMMESLNTVERKLVQLDKRVADLQTADTDRSKRQKDDAAVISTAVSKAVTGVCTTMEQRIKDCIAQHISALARGSSEEEVDGDSDEELAQPERQVTSFVASFARSHSLFAVQGKEEGIQ
jgi:hypothetical protein